MTPGGAGCAFALLLLAACGAEQAPPAAAPANDARRRTPAAELPLALRGLWGSSVADCEAGRGRTDGLLDIAATELRFHEARARLAVVVESGPRHIVADFEYEGEGETRTHREAFELLDNGLLVRRDAGGAPRAEAFAYSRCQDPARQGL